MRGVGVQQWEQPWCFRHGTMPAGDGWGGHGPSASRGASASRNMWTSVVRGGRALPGPRRGEAGVPGPQVRWGQGARGPEKPVGPQEPLGGSLHGAGRLLPASCRAAGPLRASELGCRAGGRSDFSPRERPPREQEQPSSVRLSEALTSRGEASRGSCALTPTRRDSQWAHADTQQTQTM